MNMFSVYPIFICENNRKIIKNMHCFYSYFLMSGSFEDWIFFREFQLSSDGGGVPIIDILIANSHSRAQRARGGTKPPK